MKKLVVSLVMLAGGVTAAQAACQVPYHADPEVSAAVVASGGWPISAEKCEFLNQKNLYLQVSAYQGVLQGTAVGWASVRLLGEGGVASDTYFLSTVVDRHEGSSPRARALMRESIRNAIAGLDFNLAAKQIAKLQKAK